MKLFVGADKGIATGAASLLEPPKHKWQGCFVLWDNSSPFDFIAQQYGEERILDLPRKLKANKPTTRWLLQPHTPESCALGSPVTQ